MPNQVEGLNWGTQSSFDAEIGSQGICLSNLLRDHDQVLKKYMTT